MCDCAKIDECPGFSIRILLGLWCWYRWLVLSGLGTRYTAPPLSPGPVHSWRPSGRPAPHWSLPLRLSQSTGCLLYYGTSSGPASLTPAQWRNNHNIRSYCSNGSETVTFYCYKIGPTALIACRYCYTTYKAEWLLESSLYFILHHILPNRIFTALTALFSRSILFPMTTNGKFSGSRGDACIRNSSLQESSVLNVLGMVTSKTSTQQSAPL